MKAPHTSIFVNEMLEFFESQNLSIFVDGTLGAGGHAYQILLNHPEISILIGIDQDQLAHQIAEESLKNYKEKIVLIKGNFKDLKELLAIQNIHQVDGIFLDLGVSSMQLDLAEKGFSFSKGGPLDMRMDTSQSLTAKIVLHTYSEKDLEKIFREYGEEPKSRQAAKKIVDSRGHKPLETTTDLVNLLSAILPKKRQIHPLTLIFQALRIEVNDELKVIEKVIPEAINLLRPGGRLGIITFHSLEDRIVKWCFREAAADKIYRSPLEEPIKINPRIKLLTKKPLEPTVEEIKKNPRARSAKLRFIEKLP